MADMPTTESVPKFEQYTIPGGENYREVLMHMPQKQNAAIDLGKSPATSLFERDMMEKYGGESFPSVYNRLSPSEIDKYEMYVREDRNAAKTASMLQDRENNYKSQHWDQPNVLAHLRMSDRTGPEGEKILHLEELQSDWGQAGRKQGFAQKLTPELQEQVNLIASKLDPKFVPAHARNSSGTGIDTENFLIRDINHWKETGAITPEDARVLTQYANIKSGLKLPPSAPYVSSPEGKHTSSWVDLGLKRALREAAEKGYDKLVWTPGAEQAARYDLSKHIDELHWHRGNLVAYDKDGNKVIQRTGMSASDLPDVVGKDVADKLLAQEAGSDGWRTLEGQDLKVGGEGMSGFYDKILPTQLQKLVKKLDPEAKVELGGHVIKSGKGKPTQYSDFDEWSNAPQEQVTKAHSITITPKMREAILEIGRAHV